MDELVELMIGYDDAGGQYDSIAGTEKPVVLVKSRFMKLNYSHIEYAVLSESKYDQGWENIKAYLLTAPV